MSISNNLRTTININTRYFNINNLTDVVNNKTIAIPKSIDSNITIPNIEIPDRYRFDIINIDSFNIVYIIENDVSFFTVLSYKDLILGSNIELYISSDEKYEDIIDIFYKNIYNKNNGFKNIIFTNKLIKNIPLNSININTCYKISDDFNKNKHYNCFWMKTNTNTVNIDVEEYEYQKMTDYSIGWFLSKIFNTKIINISSRNIIIHSKNLKIINGVEYIYIDSFRNRLLEMYFNWFNYSYKININLDEFILLVITYYIQKIIGNVNVFFNGFISNKSNDNIGLKYNNILCGIQINTKFTGNFEDFIKLIINKYGNVKNNIENSVKFTSIILINNIQNDIIDADNLITKLIYDPEDIQFILKTYPYSDIWIFSSIEDYKFIKNYSSNFPPENIKFEMNNNYVYRIVNNYSKEYYYKQIKLDNYVLNLNNLSVGINNVDLSQKIEKYAKKILVTVLIPDYDCINYFIKYYCNLGFHIIFINLFNLDIVENKDNIIVLKSLGELINNSNILFVKPNYFSSDCLSNNQIGYNIKYYKDIGKKKSNKFIIKYSDTDKLSETYIVELNINLYQRIKMEKIYKSIIRNEYTRLF